MRFLSMIIDLDRSQYVITSKLTFWQRLAIVLKILLVIAISLHYVFSRQIETLAVWLKILAIVCLSLWAGVEHLDFVFNRKLETLIVNLAVSFCMKSLHKIAA